MLLLIAGLLAVLGAVIQIPFLDNTLNVVVFVFCLVMAVVDFTLAFINRD